LDLDDEDFEELADLYGVEPEEVEALWETIGDDLDFHGMTADELRSYVDDLYEQLSEEGWDLDVSDLWDMYYGYAPGAK
jgi:hypothetical protein